MAALLGVEEIEGHRKGLGGTDQGDWKENPRKRFGGNAPLSKNGKARLARVIEDGEAGFRKRQTRDI